MVSKQDEQFLDEIRREFKRVIRDCPELMELLSKAISLDDMAKTLVDNESLLTDEEREVLKKWQSKLNH